MTPEMITAISAVVAACTGIMFCYQLILIKKQFNEEHRIKRNVYSNDQLRWWVGQVTRESNSARRFVEKLGKVECETIVNDEELKLLLPQNSEKEKERYSYMVSKLSICLADNFNNIVFEDDGLVTIKASEVSKIKSLCTKNLNTTEMVLSAWRHNIANRDIIEEELTFIIHLGLNYNLIHNFREASGGVSAYPAIYEFIKEMAPKLPDGSKAGKC